MKISCFIIDDERIARNGLKEYIEDTNFLQFAGEAGNPVEGVEMLTELRPDLLFLDVQMPKMTGIDFLRSFNREMEVILTTAYPEFALDGYELEVRDYLLKPITYSRFLKSVNRVYRDVSSAFEPRQLKEEPHIFVRHEGKIIRILLDRILFVESLQNYVIIHTTEDKFIIHQSLKAMLQELPQRDFIKVQKSYIVNKSKVQEIQGNRLFINSHEIPISRELKAEVLSKLMGDNLLK